MKARPVYIIILMLLFSKEIFCIELPRGIIELDKSAAAPFTVTNPDGKSYDLKSSRGKWVFLHFWASWCGPCRKEMPIVEKLRKTLDNKTIDIVLINTAEDEDTIFSFLGTVSPEMQSYMDPDGELTEIWQPRGLPTTFFIDPMGRKRFLALGGRNWLDVDYQNFLNHLLTE